MPLLGVCLCLALASLCSAQHNQLFFLAPSLSSPERFPGLGLTPRYHALVYDYITQMAGRHPPAQVNLGYPARVEDFGVRDEPALVDNGPREPVTEGPGAAVGTPVQPSHLLPSDFILLTRSPQSQFFGNFDVVKNKKMKLGVDESALPPVGGVVSNFILQREASDKVKRQTYAYSSEGDEDEGVVISAAGPRAEETSTDSNTNTSTTSETKDEPEPSVAQSKPQAIALAGAGGVAQAAPVATAVVGKNGLAIAAPSATAVAGQGANSVQIGGEEKMRRRIAAAVATAKPEKSEKP